MLMEREKERIASRLKGHVHDSRVRECGGKSSAPESFSFRTVVLEEKCFLSLRQSEFDKDNFTILFSL